LNLVSTAQRYWNTLRYLKPVQFYGRLWFRLHRPRLDGVAAPTLRAGQGGWQPPAARAPALSGPATFRFLNREHPLPEQGGWNDVAQEKLWLYNLHYFDDLNAQGAAQREPWHRALLQRWVAENPPTGGNGWEPYPTSLRIVNWVKWALAGNRLPAACMPSLMLQARWLARRLEWHLLGNHLFANAKALVLAGLFFEGPEADAWRAKGLTIIASQLPEQVLADGGNFERSPMYHAIFLEDLLDLVNAAGHWPGRVPAAQVAGWREAAARMLRWLQGMTHPDGQIALFNDAALGVAPDLAALQAYAARLGIAAPRQEVSAGGMIHFSDSGHVRLEQGSAVAFLDVAPVGPDYLPGHAHADTLSFELSVFGQRAVVNGGTSCYGTGPQRLRERGTAAHSTVEVAGENSSEVWGGFRVARRSRPFGLKTDLRDDRVEVACSHDGYRRLPGQPVHRREWHMDAAGLTVFDSVAGANHAAVARFILHPLTHVNSTNVGVWQLTLAGGQGICVRVVKGVASLEPASYAPEFGKVMATMCLAVALVAGESRVVFEWG
jgi:uncharacterized heparinase superfamily protein